MNEVKLLKEVPEDRRFFKIFGGTIRKKAAGKQVSRVGNEEV